LFYAIVIIIQAALNSRWRDKEDTSVLTEVPPKIIYESKMY